MYKSSKRDSINDYWGFGKVDRIERNDRHPASHIYTGLKKGFVRFIKVKVKRCAVLLLAVLSTVLFSLNNYYVFSEQSYIEEEMFIIPWGDQSGALSTITWKNYISEEGDWGLYPFFAVSEIGEIISVDYPTWEDIQISHFSSEGVLISEVTNVFHPDGIILSNGGNAFMYDGACVALFDTYLNVIRTDLIPNSTYNDDRIDIWDVNISGINDFIVYYTVSSINGYSAYTIAYGFNGFLDPILIYSGTSPSNLKFVTPEGILLENIEDQYGYRYCFDSEEYSILYRYTPGGDLIFQKTLISDNGWTDFDCNHFYITWSGDIYTFRATDAGVVVTEYRLNLDPNCNLVQVTDFLNPVIFLFPVEFDTPGTYDPNGDALTYEWDIDGDGIFDEPFDDVYGGSPINPTHVYTDDFDGAVSVRVRDPYDGECVATSHLTIHD